MSHDDRAHITAPLSVRPLIGRLGLLAVGLGIGAAMAAPPGTASADPLPPFDPNDFAISIDGVTLFQEGTATATSGIGDFAFADGANSEAISTGGVFDSAFAEGANSVAFVGGGGNFDSGTAVGDGSLVNSGSGGGLFDSATVFGTNSTALADVGSLDTATVFGDDSLARAQIGSDDLAYVVDTGSMADQARAGGEFNGVLDIFGNNDIASVFGTDSTALAGADAVNFGNFDLGAVCGDILNAMATGGNFLADIMP